MSSILDRLGHRAFRARRLVLAMWVVVLVLAGAGAAFLSDGTDDSFRLPGTQSGTALERLAETFPQFAGTSAQLIAVAPPGVTVTDAAVRGPVSAAVSAAAAVSGVAVVTDPYTSSPAGAVSRDGTAALVTIQLRGQASGTRAASGVAPATIQGLLDVATALQRALPAGATASLGGELDDVAMPAIGVTEGVGLVIAVAVLLVVFGSSVAAGLPLATALLGVGVSVGLSYAATAFVSVNSTAPMLALMLGLAVGIDYTLFIVHRHRGQLAAGMAVEESAARALATAGSAVVWAGLTVMVALAGLFVVGIPFLTTMGLAAAGAVGIAVLIAVTLTPALLGFAGERLRPCSRSGVRFGARIGVRFGDRFFRGWLTAVTRVPALTIAAVVGIVALLAWPAAGLRLGVPDAGSQPAGSPARVTYDLIADHFGPGVNGPLIVTGALTGTAGAAGVTGALATAGAATAGAAGTGAAGTGAAGAADPLAGLASRIAALPGVAAVPVAMPNAAGTAVLIEVIPAGGPDSPQTAELVHELRALAPQLAAEYGVDLAVTGATAVQVDLSSKLGSALVPFGLLVVGLSFVLLTVVFRSWWVPLTATVGYLLSVLAAFGVVAMVFVRGWGAGLLGVAATGPVISFLPIILMGVVFGLAMDYQVFLVSRVREDHLHHGDARRAIRTGFLASGPVITAAALIMVSVFASFVPNGSIYLKPIALGLAAGVFVDAFGVRMTLLPAVLQLLGDRAWRFPRAASRPPGGA